MKLEAHVTVVALYDILGFYAKAEWIHGFLVNSSIWPASYDDKSWDHTAPLTKASCALHLSVGWRTLPIYVLDNLTSIWVLLDQLVVFPTREIAVPNSEHPPLALLTCRSVQHWCSLQHCTIHMETRSRVVPGPFFFCLIGHQIVGEIMIIWKRKPPYIEEGVGMDTSTTPSGACRRQPRGNFGTTVFVIASDSVLDHFGRTVSNAPPIPLRVSSMAHSPNLPPLTPFTEMPRVELLVFLLFHAVAKVLPPSAQSVWYDVSRNIRNEERT